MSAKPDAQLSERQLAARWGVTPRTLQNWRAAGKGPPFLELGINTIRYRLEDIEAYEKSRTQNQHKEKTS